MVNDLRKKSNKELADLIIKLKNDLLEYRFKAAAGQLEKTHKVKLVKKTIAVSFFVLRERNVELSVSSHNYALVEWKDGKRITNSIGKGLAFDPDSVINAAEEKPKDKSKPKVSSTEKDEISKMTKTDSSSTKSAPKKIVTKSNNNQAKKTNIVKKAQRGV
ncbi:MAG: 50S ribosomal protein L29 [Mycoplasmoidaceae bacterium]